MRRKKSRICGTFFIFAFMNNIQNRFSPVFFLLLVLGVTLVSSSCKEPVRPPVKNPDEEIKKVDLLDSLKNEIEREPENQNLYLLRAQAFINRGEFEKAEADFDRCFRIDSMFDKLHQMKGDYHFNTQKFTESKVNYEKCVACNDQNKVCWLKKAKLELLLENYDLAIKDINTSIKIDEYFADAYFEKGRCYELMGDTLLAESSYSTAIEIDPDYYFAYIQIALMYAADFNDLALEYYNSALDIKPNSVEALINKGLFLQDTGWKDAKRYDEAIASYNEAEQVQAINHIPNYNKGFVYLEYKNEVDSAIMEFDQVIFKDPNNFQAYYNLGICHEKKNDIKYALTMIERSLELNPTFTLSARAKERLLSK